jgi:hypothetical protein
MSAATELGPSHDVGNSFVCWHIHISGADTAPWLTWVSAIGLATAVALAAVPDPKSHGYSSASRSRFAHTWWLLTVLQGRRQQSSWQHACPPRPGDRLIRSSRTACFGGSTWRRGSDRRRRIHHPWRRATGVWSAVFTLAHVPAGLAIHSPEWRIWEPFASAFRGFDDRPFDEFTIGYWVGAGARRDHRSDTAPPPCRRRVRAVRRVSADNRQQEPCPAGLGDVAC